MAISDIITLIISMTYSIASFISRLVNASLPPWLVVCQMTSFLILAFHSVSTYTLAAISYDRYNTIVQTSSNRCQPFFRRKKYLYAVIISVWIAGITLALPQPWIITVDPRLPYICEMGQITSLGYFVAFIVSTSLLVFLPIITIIVLYTKIVLFISRKIGIPSSLSAERNKQDNEKKKDIIRMLIVTTTIAIALTLPYLLAFLVVTIYNSTFSGMTNTSSQDIRYLLYFTSKFSVMACTHNPLVYTLMNRRFRQDLKISIRKCCQYPIIISKKSQKTGITTSAITYDDYHSHRIR